MSRIYLFCFFIFNIFCSNSQVKNCNLPNPGFTPITDLKTGLFSGKMGGLYNNGANSMPTNYLQNAISIANQIQPLNTNGQANPNGKIIFIGVGASNPRTEFNAFMQRADTFAKKNKKLLLINTCIGGQGVQKMNDPLDNYWKSSQKMFDSMGVSFNQVQIAWVETDNTQASDTVFPRAPLSLLQEYKKLLYTLQSTFPNLKLCYFSARAFSGWVDLSAGGNVGKGLLAPRDYYNGWTIKWLIDSAINGVAGFEYAGANKKIALPIYGNYSYTNGSVTRNDGFSLNCNTDVGNDGLHLTPAGEQKIGEQIFQFYLQEPVAKYWFFEPQTATNIEIKKENVRIFPNPCATILCIDYPVKSECNIYSLNGKKMKTFILVKGLNTLPIADLNSGTYVLKFANFSTTIIINH